MPIPGLPTSEAWLRRGLERQDGELTLTLDPQFQGLPDTAHGGSVLAAFLAVAESRGSAAAPRAVQGLYRKRVPLGVPLRLHVVPRPRGLECRLHDVGPGVLVDGRVEEAALPETAGDADLDAPLDAPLPVSRTCFACGTENPLGLQVRLAFNEAAVGGAWEPRETFRAEDDRVAPLALTTLLDEAAFWLGALASGESGMTTELAVTLDPRVPFAGPVTVLGRRAEVRARADDPRYWDTRVVAHDAAGRTVAEAAITFVAVRGAARRLVAWLQPLNPPAVLARVFPAYARRAAT